MHRLVLRVGIDVARYRGDSTKEFVEVLYSFDVSKLKFVRVDSALKAIVVMDVYFKRSANDSIVARQAWRIPFTTNDSTALGVSRTYADVIGFFLVPDVYQIVSHRRREQRLGETGQFFGSA